jgi:hypothetical protein
LSQFDPAKNENASFQVNLPVISYINDIARADKLAKFQGLTIFTAKQTNG